MDETILIVDDDLAARSALTRHLEEAGYHVTLAEDGAEATGLLATHRPDLILIEALLPRRDGFELCNWLKSDRRFRNTPVVLLTSLHLTDDERRNGVAVGRRRFVFRADRILSKPVCREELLRQVGELLGLKCEEPAPDDRDRILVIDHDSENAQAIRNWLERDGYPVAAATSSREGIEKSFSEQPDLILLAVTMPHQDGIDVVRDLRRHHDDEVAIVLMAQVGEGDMVADAMKAGADDYIRKPVNYSQLTGLVLEDLTEHRVRVVKRRLVQRLKSTSVDLMRKLGELHAERRAALRAQRFSQAVLQGLGDQLTVVSDDQIGQYLNEAPSCPACCARLGADSVAPDCPVPRAYRSGRACSAEVDGPAGGSVLCSATPVIDPTGRRAVVKFTRDLANRRRTASALQQVRAKLAMGTLAGRTADHLAECLEGIRRRADTGPQDDPRAALEDILSVVDRTAPLVDRLRHFETTCQPQRRPVELHECLTSAVELARAHRDGHVELHLPAQPLTVSADPLQIQQMMVDCLASMSQAPGQDAPTSVRVRAEHGPDGGTAVVRIESNSLSVPVELRENAFEPFAPAQPPARADGSAARGTDTRPDGALGLAIARHVVTAHGGSIHLEDGPQGGMAFVIRLPLVTQATGAPEPVAAGVERP